MSNYRCKKTFTSVLGKTIYFGTKLNYKDYATLPYSEQNNFDLIRGDEKEFIQQEDEFNASDLEITMED